MSVQRPAPGVERLPPAPESPPATPKVGRAAFRLDVTSPADERRSQQRLSSPAAAPEPAREGAGPGVRALHQLLGARLQDVAHPPPPAGLRMEVREGVSLGTRFTRFDDGARADGRRLAQAAERGSRELARELKRVEDDLARRAGPDPGDPVATLQRSMGLNQQLSMRYLALQAELQRSTTTLLSNLLRRRHEAIKQSIQIWPGG